MALSNAYISINTAQMALDELSTRHPNTVIDPDYIEFSPDTFRENLRGRVMTEVIDELIGIIDSLCQRVSDLEANYDRAEHDRAEEELGL